MLSDDIKKVLYLFMDWHMNIYDQTEYANKYKHEYMTEVLKLFSYIFHIINPFEIACPVTYFNFKITHISVFFNNQSKQFNERNQEYKITRTLPI